MQAMQKKLNELLSGFDEAHVKLTCTCITKGGSYAF